MRTFLASVLLLAISCGTPNPPPVATQASALSTADCPMGIWWNTDWEWACAPAINQCIYEEWRFQWYYHGRIVERSYYNTPSNNNATAFWSDWCIDTTPWPSSYAGPGTVYRIPGDGSRIIYSWRMQTQSPTSACACYTSTNGVTWNARTCFAFECYVGSGLGAASP